MHEKGQTLQYCKLKAAEKERLFLHGIIVFTLGTGYYLIFWMLYIGIGAFELGGPRETKRTKDELCSNPAQGSHQEG
jgi:hypothetical protein